MCDGVPFPALPAFDGRAGMCGAPAAAESELARDIAAERGRVGEALETAERSSPVRQRGACAVDLPMCGKRRVTRQVERGSPLLLLAKGFCGLRTCTKERTQTQQPTATHTQTTHHSDGQAGIEFRKCLGEPQVCWMVPIQNASCRRLREFVAVAITHASNAPMKPSSLSHLILLNARPNTTQQVLSTLCVPSA